MQDVVFVAITIAFFALSIGYVHLLRSREVRGLCNPNQSSCWQSAR